MPEHIIPQPGGIPDSPSAPPQFRGFKPLTANFTAAPNQFFDRILGHYHPCVVTVVGILIRSTLGWEDPDTGARRQEAELSLSDFVRPEMSRSSARTGIAGAIEAGFIVETMPATNKQAARYALRWDDAEQQRRALEKERRSHGLLKRKGGKISPPRWKKAISRGATVTPQGRGVTVRPLTITPVTATPVTVTPPLNKGVLKKSYPEKKSNEFEERAGRESFLPSAPAGEEGIRDWAALTAVERRPYEERAERELVAKLGLREWNAFKGQKSLRAQRARTIFEAERKGRQAQTIP